MSNLLATLEEMLQVEYACELAGLPQSVVGRRKPDIRIPSEKIYELRETYLGDDSEAEEFLGVYMETLRIFKSELERMDGMSDEFCSSYLEALKPEAINIDKSAVPPKRKSYSPGEDIGFEQYPVHKSRRGNLPKSATNLLKKWLFDHLFHPYPTEEEKSSLSLQTGLSLNQISNWFINARRRTLQPMLESVRQQQQGVDPSQIPPPTNHKKSKKHKSHPAPESEQQPQE